MSTQPADAEPLQRHQYGWFLPLTTRWMDNDIYGHINNAHYYSYFDTVANNFLIKECGLDIRRGEAVGYVVHSQCFYKQALEFPDAIDGGFRVNRVGTSSVEYGIGIFKQGEDEASVYGTFTHVFVNRETERPRPIEGKMRSALESLLVS